jgi:hypothetical protein
MYALHIIIIYNLLILCITLFKNLRNETTIDHIMLYSIFLLIW